MQTIKFRISKIITIFLLSTLFSQEINENSVTIHAEDANLSTILSIIAEDSDYNIVTGPTVAQDKKLTIHLDDTPILEALDLIIRASGLSYEVKGNSILVAEASKLNEEIGLMTYVIELKYANATDVKDLLKNITQNVTIDKSSNKLLIKASPKKIAEIEDVIESIDTPAIQIMLEARLIEISSADEEKLGIDWSKLAQLSTVIAENASPVNVEGGGKTGSLVPGLSYTISDAGEIIEAFEPQTTGQLPGQMYFQRMDVNNGIGFSRQMTAFDVTLDLLIKNNEATVLANSKVVTINGHEASISMVDVVPYILSSGGVGGQVQVAREEIGIKLDILPTVNQDGFITTQITPEVSSIYDFIGPDQNIPWVKKRVSNTTIRVQNNESIIIAGLLGTDKRYETNRVPFLWKLPYFGKRFFTTTSEIERKTDLIIQITPKIVMDTYSGIVKSDSHSKAEDSIKDFEEDFNREIKNEMKIETLQPIYNEEGSINNESNDKVEEKKNDE
tara:strand:- start:745 stop:2253 length:1509 start_codon:yes stop_codon:yes gene_type:complete